MSNCLILIYWLIKFPILLLNKHKEKQQDYKILINQILMFLKYIFYLILFPLWYFHIIYELDVLCIIYYLLTIY